MATPSLTKILEFTGELFKRFTGTQVKTEKKGRFTYVSWAAGWQALKEVFPLATYKFLLFTRQDKDGNFIESFVSADGQVSVNIWLTPDQERPHTAYLPVLNNMNKPIPFERMNAFDINNAMRRVLAKGISESSGIGLPLYYGEDLEQYDEDNVSVSFTVGDPKPESSALAEFYAAMAKEYPDPKKRKAAVAMIAKRVGKTPETLDTLSPAQQKLLLSMLP